MMGNLELMSVREYQETKKEEEKEEENNIRN